jgi:hypothetical protein
MKKEETPKPIQAESKDIEDVKLAAETPTEAPKKDKAGRNKCADELMNMYLSKGRESLDDLMSCASSLHKIGNACKIIGNELGFAVLTDAGACVAIVHDLIENKLDELDAAKQKPN